MFGSESGGMFSELKLDLLLVLRLFESDLGRRLRIEEAERVPMNLLSDISEFMRLV